MYNLEMVKAVDILNVATATLPGINFFRRGKYSIYSCPLPGHGGKAKNNERGEHCRLNHDRNTWFDNGCDRGGNVIDFVMHYKALSFPEAVKFIAEIGHIEPEDNSNPKAKIPARKAMMAIARNFWREHSERENYISYWKSRGLSEETANHFEPGIAPGGKQLTEALIKKGYTLEELKEQGITSNKGYDYFQRRLLLATTGNIIGRDITGKSSCSKLAMPGGYSGLMNIAEATRRKKCIMIEGPFDVVSTWQLCRNAGVPYGVVGVHGTNAYQEEWIVEMAKKGVEEIFIMFDSDPWVNPDNKRPHAAGQKAALKAARIAIAAGIRTWICKLPEETDPNEYLKAVNRGELTLSDFQQLFDNAKCPLEFALYVDNHYYDRSTLSGQIRLLDEASKHIQTYGFPATDTYWDIAARMIGRPSAEIKEFLQCRLLEISKNVWKDKFLFSMQKLKESGISQDELINMINEATGTQ